MKELEQFVDTLFSRHRETNETKELKYEILSNLEAKVQDLMQEGVEYREAITQATQHMHSIDFLIDHHRPVYVHQYRMDLVRTSLVYLLIIWILSIPLRLTASGVWTNTLITLAVAVCASLYFILSWKKELPGEEAIVSMDTAKLARRTQASWIVWGFYALTTTVWTTAVRFGSNLWFGRGISISGPYQFAMIVFDYAAPLLTIVIPLIITSAYRLLQRNEVTS